MNPTHTSSGRLSMSVNGSKSYYAKKEFPGLDLNKCADKLAYGIQVNKITKKGAGNLRSVIYFINERDSSQLQWVSDNKGYSHSRINLLSIKTITEMPASSYPKKARAYSSKLLCIYYGADGELFLVFDNQTAKYEWWCGLQYFILRAQEAKNMNRASTVQSVAKDMFLKADKDGSKALSKDEMKKILRELQIDANQKYFKEIYKQYDADGNGLMDKKEFDSFLKALFEKKELIPLFKTYAKKFDENKKDDPCMTFQELQQFYKIEQSAEVTIEELTKMAEIIGQENPTVSETTATNQLISFYDFSTLIFSRWNSIFNPERSEIFQDMDRPLTDYFMNSSHNTYLVGNQLTGESSIMGYINAIKRGCRSVEIDLWNGDHAEPIVTHGHTLTSKILFKDLILGLKEQAFEGNDYPLILSFEMHCDQKGQEKISKILEEHIRDQIFLIPTDYQKYNFYPSPNFLKNKFVIKSKGRKITANGIEAGKIEEEDEDDDEEHSNSKSKGELISVQPLKPEYQLPKPEEKEAGRDEPKNEARNSEIKIIAESKQAEKKQSKPHNPVQTFISPNLEEKVRFAGVTIIEKTGDEDLVTETGGVSDFGLVSKSFHKPVLKAHEELAAYYSLLSSKFNIKGPRTVWEIASLNEHKILSLLKHDPQAITDWTKKYFIRVFPMGTRVDSSNYDPLKPWQTGSQMVAINFQTSDEPNLINYAKFAKNGRCGYVLKPEYMLSDTLKNPSKANYLYKMTTPKLNLTVKIISAQLLKNEKANQRDIPDPLVEVKIRGADIDESHNTVLTTPVVKDNGFNPNWTTFGTKSTHSFKIHAPDFAILVFKVFDQDAFSREKMCWYAIELNDIQTGYRVIPMLDSKFEEIKNCYLFVHIALTEYK